MRLALGCGIRFRKPGGSVLYMRGARKPGKSETSNSRRQREGSAKLGAESATGIWQSSVVWVQVAQKVSQWSPERPCGRADGWEGRAKRAMWL